MHGAPATVWACQPRDRAAPEDAAAARRILLTSLADNVTAPDLLGELEPLHPRNNTFTGEVLLHPAADALAWSGASPADPLPLEGTHERYLPEYSGRGRDRRKLQYAVLESCVAASMGRPGSASAARSGERCPAGDVAGLAGQG